MVGLTWSRPLAGAAALALALATMASDSLACGGTFCDSPPAGQAPMPVDQSGENILFVLAGGRVEAHIQIQYTGDPTRFAWLVPVPATPEISVGSNQLFLNLLNATVPTFSVANSYQFCGGGSVSTPSSGGCGFGASNSSAPASFDGVGARDAGPETRSDVATGHESVGAFDVTTLAATDASEVAAWLEQNNFLYGSDAIPLLQDYINRGHQFVAVRLQPGAGVNEIHPLVISYQGTEPCIPLELTRVAATEDMGVRAFFLGDRRVVSTNYQDVTPNPERFDWVNLGSNYTSVVSRAVDEAGQHAFVTEYAGKSSVVSTQGLWDPSWDSGVFVSAQPSKVIDLLEQQGLVTCTAGSACVANHPLVLPLVRQYLPAPPGMSERDFYACLGCNAASIDQAAWDGAAFAKDLEDRVIAPGKHAVDLLSASSYTTRLFTTISPSEMTEDPTFAPASLSLPPVSQQLIATLDTTCAGDRAVSISGRPDAALDSAGQSPNFPAEMPFSLTIEKHDDQGGTVVVENKSKAIDLQIAAWNGDQGFPHPAPRGVGSASSSGSGLGGCACILGGTATHPGHLIVLALGAAIARRLARRSPRVKTENR